VSRPKIEQWDESVNKREERQELGHCKAAVLRLAWLKRGCALVGGRGFGGRSSKRPCSDDA
jgi:hypothetical protein